MFFTTKSIVGNLFLITNAFSWSIGSLYETLEVSLQKDVLLYLDTCDEKVKANVHINIVQHLINKT